MKNSTRSLTHAALIAAIYALLTVVFQPLSFGAVQFRIAEALTLLPILAADAVPGLFIGCLIANLLGGGIWYDVVLGSIATLLAAIATRKLRGRPLLAAAMPAIFNGLIVGPVVYFAYVRAPGAATNLPALLSSMGTVALGELVVCYVLGLVMVKALRHVPEDVLKL
ncbi:MAG: QueT transporter family protein [Clostridia bacterium]|nr:QueT transporter family protein [Clostridia bacterium]